ncbi:MAG: arsenate reductase [Thiomonas sp.]|uniref:arsenate reductase n=1 Tax=Thiomonas sp. TaxID=2047785 RepID=UPI002A35D671|nr:arsenate reductase [Thiomonas sp.]MDY0330752.1 arsenate reductase [Thiomonas sp.]
MSAMPTLTVYGLSQCDSVKRARQWLQSQGLDYSFVDFKKTPPSAAQISAWAEAVGWEALLNKRGTTWRKLDAATQASVIDAPSAVVVLAQHPSAIKRPVVEAGGQLLVGFDEATWREALSPGLR